LKRARKGVRIRSAWRVDVAGIKPAPAWKSPTMNDAIGGRACFKPLIIVTQCESLFECRWLMLGLRAAFRNDLARSISSEVLDPRVKARAGWWSSGSVPAKRQSR
jgi:hypothetical protein